MLLCCSVKMDFVVILSLTMAFDLILVSGDLEAQWLTPRDEDHNFTCPDTNEISPCFCDNLLNEMPTILCYGIETFRTIREALEDRFTDSPIPFLKMHQCNLVGLPARAFSNISAVRLQISGTHLNYVNPDAFSGMESLMMLILRNVLLYDVPGDSFLHLTSLVTLSLKDNKLSKLTRNNFRYLTGIKHFVVTNNRVTSIERGTFPLGLIYLSLANNNLFSLNKTVRHLPYLEWLLLSDNRVTNINGDFEGLYNLKILTLERNLLTSLGDSLYSLRKLEVLDLQYNMIFELGESFKHLYRLQWLNLSHNLLTSVDQICFHDLLSLAELDLSGNYILALNGNLNLLSRLVSVNLAGNMFSEFSVTEIRELNLLRTLNLSENNLSTLLSNSSDAMMESSVRVLLLQSNFLTDVDGFLNYFPMLEDLDISYNTVYRLWSRDFINCTKLVYMSVEGNPLVCDVHQLHVLHELENRKVEIIGMPQCAVDPDTL